ncbi:MAG: XRE family transcriptional regulator [Candidatus Methanoplasma sp.]|nr:XRE family transcriptional regulator [Candidatus Methanoplasma sp.]
MDPKIAAIAERIRSLREIERYSQEEMAAAAGISVAEYIETESGKKDFSFTFLHKCAEKLGVEMAELLTGETPKLKGYTVVRKGDGLPIERREGFKYNLLAPNFRHKFFEPFLVFAPFDKDSQNRPVPLSMHDGQEFDYVLEGSMKFCYEKHTEVLGPGDAVFYDSGKGHGMIAVSKEGCRFIAMIIKEIRHS